MSHQVHSDHAHRHGDGCGHVAVAHGDHTDYLHDGHWDDCAVEAHVTAGVHSHQHGSDCGHPTVEHGDHVDYIHDQHRHASHGDHYDEH